MELETIKNLLSRLNHHAFESFIIEFSHDPGFPFVPVPEAGQGVYYQELPQAYGDTLQSVFITHFLPIELFKKPDKVDIADPSLVERLRNVQRIYDKKTGYFGLVSPELIEAERLQSIAVLTNFTGIDKETYDKALIPKYEKLISDIGITARMGIGSFDSFTELNPKRTREAFEHFVLRNKDGLSLSLDPDHISVENFTFERNLFAGVLHGSKTPCEPAFTSSIIKEDILLEFESLIRKETKEADLEKFLAAHYKEVFGFKYDRVETQLWLRFPEIDISGKNRRLDIFLRNSIEKDWEIVEIKRVVKLNSTYRDVPVLAHEITSAMQQLKNYCRILGQDSVRRKFAAEGMEYYYPSLRLVVGERPQISLEQWRWLKSSNENDMKITTFDELLDEMKLRLTQREDTGDSSV